MSDHHMTDSSTSHQAQLLWTPKNPKQSQIYLFAQDFIHHLYEKKLIPQIIHEINYEELHQLSTEHNEEFWSFYLHWSQLNFEGESNPVNITADNAPSFFLKKWFPNTTINYAQNLIQKTLEQNSNQDILVGLDERGQRISYNKADFKKCISGLQQYLISKGLKKNDAVAAVLPNCPEAILWMLACASLGILWTSCSPDFGFQGILDRFGQIKPKLLLSCDGYHYNGKYFSLNNKNKTLVEALKDSLLDHNILQFKGQNYLERFSDDILNLIKAADDNIKFEKLNFSHPLFIMYSSGTTGKPKCMVHSHGGTIIQHQKELQLHCDLKADDTLFYFTTCGWMMWNWMTSALNLGASIICYDGSPVKPDFFHLWDVLEQEKVTHFGTSPKYLSLFRQKNSKLSDNFNLSSLKMVLSTGAPLLPEDFDYFYTNISNKVPLCSISGGTDILSCFMLGCPIKNLYRGHLQARGLGMAVHAINDNKEICLDQEAELSCSKPFPSMPIFFWDDINFDKYKKAYFEESDSLWIHGDFITHFSDGSLKVHGRSDSTLNPGGVRIGTAEIYRQVESLIEIADSIAIGIPIKGEEKIILFVVCNKGYLLDDKLKQQIKTTLKSNCSPRHIPFQIHQVEDIPYTISGKKVEKSVKLSIQGKSINNKDALKNPESLKCFHPELLL